MSLKVKLLSPESSFTEFDKLTTNKPQEKSLLNRREYILYKPACTCPRRVQSSYTEDVTHPSNYSCSCEI
jgi:hypothetical protein